MPEIRIRGQLDGFAVGNVEGRSDELLCRFARVDSGDLQQGTPAVDARSFDEYLPMFIAGEDAFGTRESLREIGQDLTAELPADTMGRDDVGNGEEGVLRNRRIFEVGVSRRA